MSGNSGQLMCKSLKEGENEERREEKSAEASQGRQKRVQRTNKRRSKVDKNSDEQKEEGVENGQSKVGIRSTIQVSGERSSEIGGRKPISRCSSSRNEKVRES